MTVTGCCQASLKSLCYYLVSSSYRSFVQYAAFNSQLLLNRMVYEDYQGTNTSCQQNVSFNLMVTDILKHVKKFKKQRKCDQMFFFISIVWFYFYL